MNENIITKAEVDNDAMVKGTDENVLIRSNDYVKCTSWNV